MGKTKVARCVNKPKYMDNKLSRKIQFTGWTKRKFSEIRNVLSDYDKDDFKYKKIKKKKNKFYCNKLKKGHEYIEIDIISIAGLKGFRILKCSGCGKKKYENLK